MIRNTIDFLTGNAPWLMAGVLLTFMSSFGQTFFISIFAGEIQAEFGLTHGSWSAIYALGTTVSAIIMVWAGGLTDVFRARSLGLLAVLGLGWACLFMALNISVIALAVVVLCLRLMGQGMASHIAIVAMARWFVSTRGRALAIATMGFAIGEMTLPIMFVFLLDHFDWRVLWVVAAGVCILSLPVLAYLLQTERSPSATEANDSHPGLQGRQWTRNDAMRHPLFWCIVPAIMGLSAFGTAVFFHQVHFADLKNVSHLSFVSLIPIYTAVAILSMVLSGIALDRFGTSRLLPFYQIPVVLAFLMFGVGEGMVSIALAFALMALTAGANATLPNAFWAETYGTAHIGSIKAMAAAVMVLGSAVGPLITGVLIDFGVPLDLQYLGVSLYFVMSSVILGFGIHTYVRPIIGSV